MYVVHGTDIFKDANSSTELTICLDPCQIQIQNALITHQHWKVCHADDPLLSEIVLRDIDQMIGLRGELCMLDEIWLPVYAKYDS